ncbi:DUF5753 domain-containing protein [Nocardia coubleae]|uniref:DUF5753 domain-containing protein n=1 Tax=Nocardia coubleae TaxID=356147 RepID=A0A846WEM2_9NOCA|nr:DUF5753 domain-containing protein [Nocardia coubleae]NKX91223.1 hypothetical protein [Nocardia coubleae]
MSYTSIYDHTIDGLAPLQRSLIAIEERVTQQRAWNPDIVIGLVQTEDYARAILSECFGVLEVPDDLDETVAARMKRQQILDRDERDFHFLIGESALHHVVGSSEIMAEQILALRDQLDARPHVRIGIVPLNARFVGPAPEFVLHDTARVESETATGEVVATSSRDVALAARLFDRLHGQAVYGQDATVVLTRVLALHTGH